MVDNEVIELADKVVYISRLYMLNTWLIYTTLSSADGGYPADTKRRVAQEIV